MKLSNIFIAVLILGLLARIISLIILPEEAYSDAIYHLLYAKEILLQQNASVVFNGLIIDTPFYHVLTAIIFSITSWQFVLPFIRFLPAIMIFLQLALLLLILRKILPSNEIIGISFAAIFPWLIVYGTINYLDTFVSVLVLGAVFALIKFNETAKIQWVIVFFFILLAMVFSSLVLLFMIPLLVLIMIFLLRKKGFLKTISLQNFIIIAMILLVILSMSRGYFECGKMFCSVGDNDPGVNPTFNNLNVFEPEFWLGSYLSFFDFPTLESFERVSFLQTIPFKIIIPLFILVTIPIFLLILFGVIKYLQEKNLIGKIIILLILSVIAIAFYITLVDDRVLEVFYVRFLIAIMPLLAILFAKGFIELRQEHFRKIAVLSLLLFAFYSLAFTGVSASYYNSIEQKHQGLYSFASTLPENANIYSKVKSRAIKFNSARNSGEIIEYDKDFYSQSSNYIYSQLKEEGFTYLVEECYRNPWKQQTINELVENNKLAKVFEDECVKVYEIQ
ncbi:MAG: hypothetical protein Q7S21_06280 [archaeon]|nr:hypothetical protein [archaeon]